MKRIEQRRVRQAVVTAVICDRCHKAIDAEDIIEVQEVVSIAFTGGFSSIFGDGTRLACDLCQHCVREVLGPFLKEVGHEEIG